jgi:ATP-dependent DNA helicase UvrD/PcrA
VVAELTVPYGSLAALRAAKASVEPPVSLEAVAGLLRGLNREQRRAVTHGDGPLLVIAGPGTGKTEVITRRIAWLIATHRAKPREILALTFTDAAADEMQARVDVLVPYGRADAQIHTFHALGDKLLREHAFELGLPGDVRLINRPEQIVLLRDNLFDLRLERYRPLGDPVRFLGALVDLFGRAKDEGIDPGRMADYAARMTAAAVDEAAHDAAAALTEQAGAYMAYQRLMAERGLIDHGDQLALTLRLLRERPATRRAIAERFRYVLVDELQDMNRAQVELLFGLTPPAGNVTVVGDLDQQIYTFRGAAWDSLRRFSGAHPGLREVVLRRNYRSRMPIIAAATRLIDHGPRLLGPGDRGTVAARRSRAPRPVGLRIYATPDAEIDGVAAEICGRIAAGESARDFAVLARSNAEIEPLSRALTVRGVAVRTHTQADFFAQPVVRPLVAFLRCVADPSQTIELYVLATSQPYALGGAPLTELLADARRAHRPLWDVLQRLAQDRQSGKRDAFASGVSRLVTELSAAIEASHERSAGELLYEHLRQSGNLAHLAAALDPVEPRAVARFFDIVRGRAALLTDPRVAALVPQLDSLIEAADETGEDSVPDSDAVSVLTVHRAKGLEFRVVYLTGLVDGRFPTHSRPPALSIDWSEVHGETRDAAEDRLAEERRLCYVAMTRARDELWLSTHVQGAGARGRRRPSPFIAEALDLPVDKAVVAAPGLAAITPQTPAQPVSTPATVAQTSFSFSQLEEYRDCPERYRLRYVVGLPTPAHHALSYGRALHSAAAWFHLQVARGATPGEQELFAEFRHAWVSEGFLSRDHEEARFAAGLRSLARFRAQEIAQPSPVVAVERPFEMQLGAARVRGRMDRVDQAPDAGAVIVDYKSSDVRVQRKADEKARDSLQLRVYALAHETQTGSLPARMELHFLETGLVGSTTPDPARLEKARAEVAAAIAGIGAGVFEAKPNPVACGYCPFRQICPQSAA